MPPLGAHTTSADDAARVFTLMMEGMSVRAISRVTGIHKTTILALLSTVGEKCWRLFDARVRNVRAERVQCDELWQFVYCKARNIAEDKRGVFGYGDVWTWIGIDADTKLIVSWLVSDRSVNAASEFMQDLASRLANRIQLTTDGLKVYWPAVDSAFSVNVDYAMIQKIFAEQGHSGRYSPARFVRADRQVVTGDPDPDHISTSYVERTNLTIRQQLRRFSRLTISYSKKVDNLQAAVAIFMAWYNFCRVHQTLRVTPAMQAGLTDHVWTMQELWADAA